MANMPAGEPKSVPDEAGELYDREMARFELAASRRIGVTGRSSRSSPPGER